MYNMRGKFFILFLLLLVIGTGFSYSQMIKGKVTAMDDGSPLPGVSVSIKGTTDGTITNVDGIYQLNGVDDKTVLVFSFIGMTTQEILVGDQKTINVSMDSEFVGMDEVVVVAYGTAKKESITGAVSSVQAKTIESRPVTNVAGVLEGSSTGIQVNNSYGEPGSNPTIRIRGFSSVTGSNAPLYVIDGVPYGGNISDLDPNDIESLSVLKDASASALYGNKASNGVILITTKKGKKGTGSSINFSTNQGIYVRGISEYDRMGADDFMETSWKGYKNSLVLSNDMTEDEAAAEASSSLIDEILVYNIYNKDEEELIDTDGKLSDDANIYSGYDDLNWDDAIERVGYRQNYSINGGGSTDKGNYFMSGSYLNEKGYVISSDYQRFTGRVNVDFSPKEWMKVGMNISGSYQKMNNTTGDADNSSAYANPFFFARMMAPIYPIYSHDMDTGEYELDEDGNKQYDSGEDYGRPQYSGRHVIWEYELNEDKTTRTTLQDLAFMDLKFLKDFTFTVKGNLSLRKSNNQVYQNSTIGDGSGTGRGKKKVQDYRNYSFMQQLRWNKNLQAHHIEFLLGHENYNYHYEYLYAFKTGETLAGNSELVNFSTTSNLTSYSDNYATESYLSQLKYSFKDKYFVDASFRTDGSSKFYSEKRWGSFWSLGGSWSISKEPFMQSLNDKVNSLKLRASYGEVGNDGGNDDDAIGYYAYMALYDLSQNGGAGAVYKTQKENYNLQWETSGSFDVAIEGRVFNRLNFSVDYFDKRSKDLLFDVDLALSTGGTTTSDAEATVTKNLGSVTNHGVEVSLDVDAIRKNNWKWNVGINGSILRNKIVKMPEQNRENGLVSGTKKYMEGHSVYDFWMYQFVGVDQVTGNSLYEIDSEEYTDPASEIDEDYLAEINGKYYTTNTTYGKKDWSGDAIPDLYGSISTNLTYKNISLGVLCTYSIGGKMLDYTYKSLMSVGSSPTAYHKDLLKSWTGVPDGMTETSENRIDPNGIPVINYDLSTYNNATSSRFLQDASYFVIKNINLSYNLPASLTEKWSMKGATINASVENLATFTALQGMNPQQSFNGINDNAFVTARVFSLGVNVKL